MPCSGSAGSGMSLADWATALGPVVAVIIFSIERYASYKTRRRDLELQWYYKLLLDTSQVYLEQFFIQCDNIFSSAITAASPTQPQSASVIAALGQEFRNAKVIVELRVVALFYTRYEGTAQRMTESLNDLQDAFTDVLTAPSMSTLVLDNYKRALSIIRARIYSLLSDPVEHRSKAKDFH